MRLVKAVILSFLVCFAGLVAKGAENPALGAISFDVASVVAGNSLRGTVTLNRPAPFDLNVSLAADPADGARLPASVTVPAGAVSAGFTISTPISKAAVGGSDSVVTIYGNYGVTRRASFTILAPVSFDEMVDRVVEREHAFVNNMKRMHPLIETYIQNLHEDKNHNVAPLSDRYFLGRFEFGKGVGDQLFEKEQPGLRHQLLAPFRAAFSRQFSSRIRPDGHAGCQLPEEQLLLQFRPPGVPGRGALHCGGCTAERTCPQGIVHGKNMGRGPRFQHCAFQWHLHAALALQLLPAL